MTQLLILLFLTNSPPLDFKGVETRISAVTEYSALVALIENEIGVEDFDGNKISFTIERELGNNTQQVRFGFITKDVDTFFHLSLVKKGNQLIYCFMTQAKKKKGIVFEETAINNYLNYFNSKVGTSKSRKDFTAEIDAVWMFSNGCGFSGDPTKEWKKLEIYISRNKVNKVRKYLYSLDVESQAYGIIGMIKLSEKGIVVSDKDVEIINFLRKKNSKVYTCLGCCMGDIIGTDELIKYWEN